MARKKAAPGTWIERELFRFNAFMELVGKAAQVLIIILGKRHIKAVKMGKKSQYVCTNSEDLSFTYKEAEALGLSKPQFTKAIDELLAKGFIEIVHQGGAYKADKTIYKLSEKWRLWKPGVVFSTRNRDFIKRGYQGKNKNHVSKRTHTHACKRTLKG